MTAIDTEQGTVTLEDGRSIPYGALLLAPGAEPVRLPIPGADLPHVHYVRTLEDSRSIIAGLPQVRHAVVIGAGFIGLETAASLRHRQVPVTVVAPEEVPLAGVIGQRMGAFVHALHEEHGVGFRLGRTVAEIHEGNVVLDDGDELPADLVVVGVGVRPRVELAERAGLEVDHGIVVDERLRTSDPLIWAAGDVASYPDQNAGRTRIEHWVHAQRQGQAAAANMLGAGRAFTDVPYFWTNHYGLDLRYSGHAHSWDEVRIDGSLEKQDFTARYFRAGALLAAASVGRDLENLTIEATLQG